MQLSIAGPLLAAFLLAVTRNIAWIFVSPPFAGNIIPTTVKAALAVALALPIAPGFAAKAPPLEVGPLLLAAVGQVLAGATLGFLVYLVFAAVQAAGDLVDLFGGFTIASVYDPLSNNTSSIFGRLEQIIATTLLFVTNGHLLLIRGLTSSYDALPLTGRGGGVAQILTLSLGRFTLSALEIAGPLVAVLVLTELGLGLLSRAAPALNVLQLGFPVKILITLVLSGLTLGLLPGTIGGAVRAALSAATHIPGLVGA